MARMLDMIKQSAVPATLMRSASRGALALPPAEMIEILVYLAAHPLFGEQARMTLAGWDEHSAQQIAADPATPVEVLRYFINPKNLRPSLLPRLLENHSVPEECLIELAQFATPEQAALLLASPRVMSSHNVLHVLEANERLEPGQLHAVRQALERTEPALPAEVATADEVLETPEMREFLAKHAAEIEAEQNKEFELVKDLSSDEPDDLGALLDISKLDEELRAAELARIQKEQKKEESEKVSTLQKIAKLNVGERVQLAMKGTKDERFVLIRDGSKVVSLAVLESPKVTDTEVEMFASMKNVQEAVLRGIASKRKFMKNYAVIRQLVNNPRSPLDLALPLLAHLLVMDLRHLSMNKNVGDVLRKIALKMYKEKSETRKRE